MIGIGIWGWAGDQRWRLEASVCTWPIVDWARALQIGTDGGVFGGYGWNLDQWECLLASGFCSLLHGLFFNFLVTPQSHGKV